MRDLVVGQWMAYDPANNRMSVEHAVKNVLDYMEKRGMETFSAATRILIAPGYEFKLTKGLITNFHQPCSTLLLLVSAFVKGEWRRIYDYALEKNFRFLSYGDSSILISDTFGMPNT
jgi:S-adenosylmethionine:tRNA ribosyltransferase-isomerase